MNKPRVKFYNNGMLILEHDNDYSLKWYSFDLNRALYESLMGVS